MMMLWNRHCNGRSCTQADVHDVKQLESCSAACADACNVLMSGLLCS